MKNKTPKQTIIQQTTHIFLTRCVILAAFVVLALSQANAYAQTYSAPITITNENYSQITINGIISGNWESTNINTPAVRIKTALPVTIINSRVRGPGHLIKTDYGGNSLIVRNTYGYGTNPNIDGKSKGSFVAAENVAKLVVENCYIEGTSFAVYVNNYAGDRTNSDQTIKILRNRGKNMDGRHSDGNGGYKLGKDDKEWSHFVQLNHIYGVPNMEIAWNESINEPYNSLVEDVINIINSSGTAANPLLIHDNYIQGAYAADPGSAARDGYTGGGIITDGFGSDTAATVSAFVKMFNNQVVSTANYGLGILAGHDNEIYNNRVVSSGVLADGTFIANTYGNGFNHWNYVSQSSTVMYNNSVHDNFSGLVRARASSGGQMRADYWLPAQNYQSRGNISLDHTPTLADETAEFTLWNNKIAQNQIQVGPTVIPNGIYNLVNRNSGKVLDVKSVSLDDRAKVIQWMYNGGDNQKWRIERRSDGSYTLTAVHSGKLLDVPGRSTVEGVQLQQYFANSSPAQSFTIEKVTGGNYYRVVNIYSGKALEVRGGDTGNGAAVEQRTINDSFAQQWSLETPQ